MLCNLGGPPRGKKSAPAYSNRISSSSKVTRWHSNPLLSVGRLEAGVHDTVVWSTRHRSLVYLEGNFRTQSDLKKQWITFKIDMKYCIGWKFYFLIFQQKQDNKNHLADKFQWCMWLAWSRTKIQICLLCTGKRLWRANRVTWWRWSLQLIFRLLEDRQWRAKWSRCGHHSALSCYLQIVTSI